MFGLSLSRILEFVRIGIWVGIGVLFGQDVADGEIAQGAITGAVSVVNFIFWLAANKWLKPTA